MAQDDTDYERWFLLACLQSSIHWHIPTRSPFLENLSPKHDLLNSVLSRIRLWRMSKYHFCWVLFWSFFFFSLGKWGKQGSNWQGMVGVVDLNSFPSTVLQGWVNLLEVLTSMPTGYRDDVIKNKLFYCLYCTFCFTIPVGELGAAYDKSETISICKPLKGLRKIEDHS